MASKYRNTRDNAKKEFEEITFHEDKKRESLQEICTKNLARYDAEIDWYDRHADRRRLGSGAVRVIAVVLGTLSALFVGLRAFSTGVNQASVTIPILGWDLLATATGVAIVAGGVLLFDSVFQITARYARWRVAEYTIRVMRSDFEIEFLKQYGAFAEDQIDLSKFQAAKAMAIEKFKAVQNEIKAETESWQQSLDKAMTDLRQRIEKDTKEAKEMTLETIKVDKERLAKERQEEKEREKEETTKREPVLLDVTIDAIDGRLEPLTLLVRDKRKREMERTTGAKPGQTFPYSLIPGPYTVHLLGNDEVLITAKSKRLTPGTDATLTV